MKKLRIKYRLLSPLSHIGETASTGSYFQTILTSAGRVPVVTGNSIRGKLRDCMALHLLDLLDAKVGKDTFNILFSGGNINGAMKDDVEKAKAVRAHFPLISLLGGGLLFFSYGVCTNVETPVENITLLKRYAERYGLQYYILDCLGEADCWEQCSRFILYPETPEERRIFDRTNHDFAKKAEAFCRENGVDLQIIGMRKAESARRRAVLNAKGAIYQTQERASKTCCPLAGLTSEDIWAYIFDNGLEYLPIYDYPYIDRRKNRNEITLLYNDVIIQNGMIFHYKKMYPDFFDWLRREYGDVL